MRIGFKSRLAHQKRNPEISMVSGFSFVFNGLRVRVLFKKLNKCMPNKALSCHFEHKNGN